MQDCEPACDNCRCLQSRVNRLLIDRQRLLEDLSAERERANALFVSYPPQAPATALPAQSPAFHGAMPLEGGLPLRYQVVDAVNSAVKKVLPGAHVVGRRLALSLRRRRT